MLQRTECQLWVEQNMPCLDRHLGPMTPPGILKVLNAATGLNLPGHGLIDRGLEKFHRALLAMTPEQRAEIEDRAAAGAL